MKTIWVNREGLLQNRVRGQQFKNPVVCVSVGEKIHMGYSVRISGPSRFVYLDLNGRFAIQLETEGEIKLEVKRGEWRVFS